MLRLTQLLRLRHNRHYSSSFLVRRKSKSYYDGNSNSTRAALCKHDRTKHDNHSIIIANRNLTPSSPRQSRRNITTLASASILSPRSSLALRYDHLQSFPNNRQSTRTYIFFENFLNKLFPTEKKDKLKRRKEIIVFKMMDSIECQTNRQRQKLTDSSDSTKEKFKVWKVAKQNKMQTYYSDRKTQLDDFRDRSSETRTRWSMKTVNKLNKLLTKTRRRRDRIKGRLRLMSSRYVRYVVTIDEPSQKEWFSPDGYPLTSKDPDTDRYVNPWNSESTNGFKRIQEVWRWKKTRFGFLDTSPPPSSSFVGSKSKECLKIEAMNPTIGEIKLTWIGHATNLIHVSDQFTVLTDPIFSRKASPFQRFQESEFFGVPRWIPPSLTVDDLDVIDVVVISHDHYDHLDLGSVQELHEKNKVRFWAVPMGMKDWFTDNIGIDDNQIIELEWWQSVKFAKNSNDDNLLWVDQVTNIVQDRIQITDLHSARRPNENILTLTCAPAQHWCSRTPFDRNTRLWCSWAIHSTLAARDGDLERQNDGSFKSFYFAGDTGYPEIFPLHQQIGDLLGPFDLSAIPIGAYKPRFFMHDSHCDPHEALQIHKDIRSKCSIAIHWGTFPLANESFEEPPTLLRKAVLEMEAEGTSQSSDFVALPHGESICTRH
jgi:N-acyl-phosphatidylethanolamine-hydrolysing phospholipase D